MSTIIGKFVPVGGPDGRKEFHVTTMKERGDGWVGLKEDETKSYHVYNSYWKFEPAWNGEGLPPVGTECEVYDSESGWEVVFIKYVGNKTVVLDLLDGDEYSFELSTCDFRPVRTEAERKRDQAIDALTKTSPSATTRMINAIYNAIAAGKIPGVELTK